MQALSVFSFIASMIFLLLASGEAAVARVAAENPEKQKEYLDAKKKERKYGISAVILFILSVLFYVFS